MKRGGGTPHPTSRRRQRGVALIIALILVALAAVLATKLTFDGYLERRRSIGMLAAEQAFHFDMGAEALAAEALSRDFQTSPNQTTLMGLWAQPSQPMPITPQDDPEGEPIGTVQGALEDMQGRFNLNNLAHVILDPTTHVMRPDPQPLEQFQRLLARVGLETKWAGLARDWIDDDDMASSPDGAEDSVYTSQTPPYRTGNWPMMSSSELMNLPGLDAARYRKIAPYVTALPTSKAQVNTCTASLYVLESLDVNLSGNWNPEILSDNRKTGCFPDTATFNNVLGAKAAQLQGLHDTKSKYFRLTTRVRLGTMEFTLYSLLQRGGGKGQSTPLLRSFGTP